MSKINDDDFDALLNNDENENKKGKNEESDESDNKPPKAFRDFMKTLIQSMVNQDSNFENRYGDPHSVEYSKDGEFYTQRKTWIINGGEVVEVTHSREPFDETPKLTLEERLAEAIEHEDYELAASLRDELNNKGDI